MIAIGRQVFVLLSVLNKKIKWNLYQMSISVSSFNLFVIFFYLYRFFWSKFINLAVSKKINRFLRFISGERIIIIALVRAILPLFDFIQISTTNKVSTYFDMVYESINGVLTHTTLISHNKLARKRYFKTVNWILWFCSFS